MYGRETKVSLCNIMNICYIFYFVLIFLLKANKRTNKSKTKENDSNCKIAGHSYKHTARYNTTKLCTTWFST